MTKTNPMANDWGMGCGLVVLLIVTVICTVKMFI